MNSVHIDQTGRVVELVEYYKGGPREWRADIVLEPTRTDTWKDVKDKTCSKCIYGRYEQCMRDRPIEFVTMGSCRFNLSFFVEVTHDGG